MPAIIAHRGASREYPENSIPAFERALALGADGIELDVHATRDGVVVVHHDADVAVSGGDDPRRAIAAMTVAELRRSMDASALPTLAEVLALVGERATVYVELKGADIEAAVVEVIRGAPNVRVAVHSFDHRAVRRVGEIAPQLPLGILEVSRLVDPVRAMRDAGARDRWQQWQLIDADLVRTVHAAGGRVVAWTVNERQVAERLRAWGVDALCTDVATAVDFVVRL
jgi:glycerophosphoryl diester phosphodiesterase